MALPILAPQEFGDFSLCKARQGLLLRITKRKELLVHTHSLLLNFKTCKWPERRNTKTYSSIIMCHLLSDPVDLNLKNNLTNALPGYKCKVAWLLRVGKAS